MSLFAFVLQAVIVLSSCTAIALLAQLQTRRRRWGYLIGLVGQPAWLFAGWHAGQWGIVLVALWWTGWFAWGCATHWRRA